MAPGGFVKNRILSLSSVATLAVVFGMISWGSAFAQTTPSTPTDQPTPQTQPTPTPDTPPTQQTPQTQPTPTPTPDTPPATQQPPSSQTPDQAQTPSSKDNTPANSTPSAAAPSAGTSAASDSQSFSGTVEKSGDKYVLKDDSGKTYDIDHQSDVSKFEGKRVRVQGKLDDSGTKILVK
jgi:hypothetical protein